MQVLQDCNAVGALKGRTILITGASAGLGVETARTLYESGAQLYLGARDMPKLHGIIDDIVAKGTTQEAPRPEPLEIHLDSLESVREAAEQFKQKSGGKLNILVRPSRSRRFCVYCH